MRKLIQISLLFLIILPGFLLGQNTFKVKGKVTDAKTKEPLIGASVVLKVFNVGAASDFNGNFSFEVPTILAKGQTSDLVASFVNYKKQTVSVTVNGSDITNDFSLEEDILQMQTVVVTGIGTSVEKSKLGNTIGQVSAEQVANSKALDVISAIQGKVANVEITQTSGEAGASTYIRIRGAHSITGGTQPLMVVDGSPINNQEIGVSVGGVTQQNRASDINPKDIESISILKGASAAALYGSRALNGVVLITTKSGKAGKAKVSYDLSYSYDDITQVQPLQQLYGQGTGGVASKTASGTW
ncbi:MAG: TonB-dependent receptor plug domain-containing protein, partial [Ignavibacteriales bacterium]|nr:TonB-dependent receptor plug domain-containing protein [Ignavibacteriales bacterium]